VFSQEERPLERSFKEGGNTRLRNSMEESSVKHENMIVLFDCCLKCMYLLLFMLDVCCSCCYK
jgi:hypothetical protein